MGSKKHQLSDREIQRGLIFEKVNGCALMDKEDKRGKVPVLRRNAMLQGYS